MVNNKLHSRLCSTVNNVNAPPVSIPQYTKYVDFADVIFSSKITIDVAQRNHISCIWIR